MSESINNKTGSFENRNNKNGRSKKKLRKTEDLQHLNSSTDVEDVFVKNKSAKTKKNKVLSFLPQIDHLAEDPLVERNRTNLNTPDSGEEVVFKKRSKKKKVRKSNEEDEITNKENSGTIKRKTRKKKHSLENGNDKKRNLSNYESDGAKPDINIEIKLNNRRSKSEVASKCSRKKKINPQRLNAVDLEESMGSDSVFYDGDMAASCISSSDNEVILKTTRKSVRFNGKIKRGLSQYGSEQNNILDNISLPQSPTISPDKSGNTDFFQLGTSKMRVSDIFDTRLTLVNLTWGMDNSTKNANGSATEHNSEELVTANLITFESNTPIVANHKSSSISSSSKRKSSRQKEVDIFHQNDNKVEGVFENNTPSSAINKSNNIINPSKHSFDNLTPSEPLVAAKIRRKSTRKLWLKEPKSFDMRSPRLSDPTIISVHATPRSKPEEGPGKSLSTEALDSELNRTSAELLVAAKIRRKSTRKLWLKEPQSFDMRSPRLSNPDVISVHAAPRSNLEEGPSSLSTEVLDSELNTTPACHIIIDLVTPEAKRSRDSDLIFVSHKKMSMVPESEACQIKNGSEISKFTPGKLTRQSTYTKDDSRSETLSRHSVLKSDALLENSVGSRLSKNMSSAKKLVKTSGKLRRSSSFVIKKKKSPEKLRQSRSTEKEIAVVPISPIVNRSSHSISQRFQKNFTPSMKKTVPTNIKHRTPPSSTSTPFTNKKEDLRKKILTKEKQQGSSRTKMPNFALIHQKNFDKMENLIEMKERKAARALLLLSGQKPKIIRGPLKTPEKKIIGEKYEASKALEHHSGNTKYAPPLKPKPADRKRLVEKKTGLLKPKSRLPRAVAAPEKKDVTRFGFKINTTSSSNMSKDEQKKAVASKSKLATTSTVEHRRNEIQGVRTNRRFELLMKQRMNKK